MKSKELKAFFKFLCGKKAESGFTDRLSALVDKIKNNAEWLEGFMTWDQEINIRIKEMHDEIYEEAYEKAYDEAYTEAAEEKAIETAQNFLVMGILPEQVAKGTGLPLEKVLELQREMEPVKA